MEKPDTLLDDIKGLIDSLPENKSSVVVNVDNSNKNEAAGGNSDEEVSSKKDSTGSSAEKTGISDASGKSGTAGKTSSKSGQASMSANVPKTGDDSNIGLWAVIAVLALIAGGVSAGYAVYKVRKKDRRDE